jgi:hypothetical protein
MVVFPAREAGSAEYGCKVAACKEFSLGQIGAFADLGPINDTGLRPFSITRNLNEWDA